MTPRDRQTLLFSATLEGEVGRIAAAYTHDARRHEHVPAPEKVGHIDHRFHRVAHEAKVSALVHELGDPKRGLTLVFVRTKRGADRLVKRLGKHDVQAVAMHGDKSQSQREKALARFEAGKIDTLVATDVAARGIDVTGITHVINYDAPGAREDYVHRDRPHGPRRRERRRHHVRARRPGARRREVRVRARARARARRRCRRRAAGRQRPRPVHGRRSGRSAPPPAARSRRVAARRRGLAEQLRLRRRELRVGQRPAPAAPPAARAARSGPRRRAREPSG